MTTPLTAVKLEDSTRCKRRLLNTLLKIKAKLNTRRLLSTYGLCAAIDIESLYTINPGQDELVRNLFARWPEGSGVAYFPVPGKNGQTAYDAYYDNTFKWIGRYGMKRHRLLSWMITTLEAELHFAE